MVGEGGRAHFAFQFSSILHPFGLHTKRYFCLGGCSWTGPIGETISGITVNVNVA